jgi:hypothetical protein
MFFSYGPEIGYSTITTSGVINDSGKPQALYRMATLSGGTAGTVTLFDGTSGSGTFVYSFPGVVSSMAFDNAAVGMVFPKGLFISFDSNVSKVTVWCRQVQNV